MTTILPPQGEPPQAPERPGRRRLVALLATVVAVVLAIVAALLVVTTRGANAPAPGTTPTTAPAATASPPPATTAPPTTAPSTSGPAASTTPAAPAIPPGTETAVWPAATGTVRYGGPVAAARGFATQLAGFTAPVLGPFRAGDASSGEVEVRPETVGPVTTVLVRRFADGTWWVLGAATADIRLDSPAAGTAVTSPVTLTGEAVAFEGYVTVRILQDGNTAPLASGVVHGGGDILRPFAGSFDFPAPTSPYGSAVLTTESARDGQVWSASVVRIRFAGAG
jgi:cytoskeletal protein RodZ